MAPRSRAAVLARHPERELEPPILRRVVAAPVTTTVRGIPTAVPLGPAEGFPAESVASFDNVETVLKAAFTRRLGAVAPARGHEICEALRNAVDR